MAHSTPGMNRNPKAAFHWPISAALSAQVSLLAIADQIGGDIQFFTVNARQIGNFLPFGEGKILQKEIKGIHLEGGSGILQRRHGEEASLGMPRGTPCALPAAIRPNSLPDDFRVWNFYEYVGKRGRLITLVAARAPNLS